MIKIIRNSQPFIQICCNHCNSELAYQTADVRRKDMGGNIFYLIDCPVCGKAIIIETITYEQRKKEYEERKNNA